MEQLKDQELEYVSGGYIFYAKGIIGSDEDYPWELLDGKGAVLGRYKSRDEVIYNAGKRGEGFMELQWLQVQQLRSIPA